MIIVKKCYKKNLDKKIALEEISFEVKKGEIFGFLGPSGSGKTTMIKILTGQLNADSGQTELLGKVSEKLTPADLEQIGLVSDTSGFYEKLSLYKNLQAYAKLYGKPNARVDEVLKQVDLYDSKNLAAEKLSTGMKQRMFLARALINKPQVLFLDEPTSGLDPTTSKKIHELLLDLKEAGTTIFLTTHDMNEATLLCDRLSLLNRGHLIEYGTPSSIIQKYNHEKKVQLTFADETQTEITFEELGQTNLIQVVAIHSCEPTLEEIFIQLTGEKLND